jgi:hypothetical protein
VTVGWPAAQAPSPKALRLVELHQADERSADDVLAVATEQSRGRQVQLLHDAQRVEGAVGDRRKVVQVGVAIARLLELALRLAQLAVLHFQLDLVNLEIVQQPLFTGGRQTRVALRALHEGLQRAEQL